MENFSADAGVHTAAKGLFEYLLIVTPRKDVYNKVMEEKHYFSRTYAQPVATKTQPHITISDFLAWDSMEDSIIRWLQRIIKEQKSFPVILNNYSGFPDHTIYVRVQDPVPFKELAARIKAIDPYIKKSDHQSAKFISYPHMTIARRLPKQVYEQAIKDYAGKDFVASFTVTELVLLRRQHPYDTCKEVAVFRLQTDESSLN
ncbi:MAG: 2'-5' RNA ligase family protein [Chitinophagaceae bacterium]|nr:2'-5' RNA ligase family protein [Chitinophagaceae bacterium]